jgi:hypothetical protein
MRAVGASDRCRKEEQQVCAATAMKSRTDKEPPNPILEVQRRVDGLYLWYQSGEYAPTVWKLVSNVQVDPPR